MRNKAKCVPGTAVVFLSVSAINKLAGRFRQGFVDRIQNLSWGLRSRGNCGPIGLRWMQKPFRLRGGNADGRFLQSIVDYIENFSRRFFRHGLALSIVAPLGPPMMTISSTFPDFSICRQLHRMPKDAGQGNALH
jgi:hypothetical protein